MSLEKDRNFEEKLKQVKPVKVNELLVQRIESEVKKSQTDQSKLRWKNCLCWGGLIAAACLMIVAGLSMFNEPSDSLPARLEDSVTGKPLPETKLVTEQSFKPILAQNKLKERVDEGIVFLDGGLTARRYRYEFIDRVVWKNPSNGALVEMEVPRDEIFLVPVQTY